MLHILRSENAIDAEAETDAEMGDVAQQPPAADREVEGGEVGSRRVRAKTVPSGPARKSARLHEPAAAMPSVEKAQRRAAARNLELTGVEASG